jgi:hypothetical protein
MSIPVDTYFIVTPGSNVENQPGFYAKLGGTDLFFYITETQALRVVNMNSTATSASPGLISFSLAQGVNWISVITQPGNGTVHVYYQNAVGLIFYAPYSVFGGGISFKQVASVPAGVITFSTLFTNTSTPPSYMLMADDGIRHTLYVAADPAFQGLISTTVTYNNSLAPAIFIDRPSIAMHPADTNKITVTCQQTIVLTSVIGVGFYEVKVAGIT